MATVLAKAVMHGLLQAGMANCGKHFPGHGFVKADSHTEIPVDKRSLKAILADDAAPYAGLSATLTSVMPAHVIYPKVDSRPAGFSSRWLNDILRGQLAACRVQTAAVRFGLHFIPLLRERYFFAVGADAVEQPKMRKVIDVVRSAFFRESVQQLAGYDATDTGEILTLQQAFHSAPRRQTA